MELREKKKKLSMLPPVSPSSASAASTFAQEVLDEADAQRPKPADEPEVDKKDDNEDQDKEADGDKTEEEEKKNTHCDSADNGVAADVDESSAAPFSDPDTVVVVEASSAIHDHVSDATQSDSHPASPFITSSEIDHSTKASSLSESTDETVQPDKGIQENSHDELADNVCDKVEETVTCPVSSQEPAAELDSPSETKSPDAPEDPEPQPTATDNLSSETRSPTEAVEVVETAVPDEPKSPPLRIPKSKFSTPDLRAAVVEDEDVPVPAIPTADTKPELDPVNERPAQGPSKDSTSSPSNVYARNRNLDPIRTDLGFSSGSARSSRHFSDDEELLDELQSAVVQEAMPIAVAKSPITSAFPTLRSAKEPTASTNSNRSVSQPMSAKPTLLSATDVTSPTGRSSSSGNAFFNKASQQQQASALLPKKPNLGSSISQRIKALEKLSANSETEVRPKTPSTSFFPTGKTTIRKTSRSPSVIERATSFVHNSPPPTSAGGSPDTTRQPSRDRSSSLKNRLSMFEPEISPPRGRMESVQVRAKIVRDATQASGSTTDPNDYGPLDLKQSPLFVDHQRADADYYAPDTSMAPPPPPKDTLHERRMSKEIRRDDSRDRDAAMERKARRSSLSVVKDFILDRGKSLTSPSTDVLAAPTPSTPSRSPSRPSSTHQNTHPRRLSISSRRSSVSKDPSMTADAMSPSAPSEMSGDGDDARSISSDKRSKGRAGRFMRRLSSSLGGRSKTTPAGMSPTLHEESAETAVSGESKEPTIEARMGDVNVQFPDNLLWKRRCMSLDSDGYLLLSMVSAAGLPSLSTGAGVKKYHMSEFRLPYAPGIDAQELPNSVVLDFIEGPGLQIACEDRVGQLNVLQSEFTLPTSATVRMQRITG
jgi:hypothetical protein